MARLKGSTLLEATLALTVISIVLTAGYLAFGNLVAGKQTTIRFRANLVMEQIASQTLKAERYWDETFEKEGLIIDQTVTAIDDKGHLLNLELMAKNQSGQIIASWKRSIYVE